jgi:hypothetical protein
MLRERRITAKEPALAPGVIAETRRLVRRIQDSGGNAESARRY